MTPPSPSNGPALCRLENKLFSSFADLVFRRAESDGAPVMVVPLGDRQAALPLRALQREFGIADDSPDGRMLAQIAEALDFVEALRPGDALPAEVLSGEASWQPHARYLALALGKLRFQLLAWIDPEAAGVSGVDAAGLDRLEADPAHRARVQRAFEQAALTLGLEGPQQAVDTLSRIAQEMSYIEALRDDLLRPVRQMQERLAQLQPGRQMGSDRQGVLERVRRLAQTAQARIAGRFADVDTQSADLTTGLRNAASQCAFIRSNRDWLYRSKRAWEPTLALWVYAPTELDDALWAVVSRTYQFLAPRFMPVQEWPSAWGGAQPRVPPRSMTW